MADGRTHEKVNLIILKITAGISIICIIINYILLLNFSLLLCISPIIGALLGLFNSPDNDLVGINFTQIGRLIKIIIPSQTLYEIVCKVHTIFWSVYIVAVPHRSFISHSLIIGALGRLIYILFIIFVIQFIFTGITLNIFITSIINLCYTYTYELIVVFIFWNIQDASHLYLDNIFLYPRKSSKKFKTYKKRGIEK